MAGYEEKRARVRTKAHIAIEILTGPGKGRIFETRDISEQGALIKVDTPVDGFHPGTLVEVRVTGLMGEEPVELAARAVRVEENAIALQFESPIKDSQS